MQDFGMFLDKVFDFMHVEIEIWGYSFSYFDLFLFSSISGIVGYVIYELFDL